MADSWKITLPCTRAEAESLDRDIPELEIFDPVPVLLTQEVVAFDDNRWELVAYVEGKPTHQLVATLKALISSAVECSPVVEKLPEEDWLTLSQSALAPVTAGRFFVHNGSNATHIPADKTAFTIPASQAFGTGGHETTFGCLAMLDHLRSSGTRFSHIADIGTGTGLLAFAAQRLWPKSNITASDIDPVSIAVTADNARENSVPLGNRMGQIALCVATGTDAELIQTRAPFDLLIANILAGPLIELAPAFSTVIGSGGRIILAGLLNTQAQKVLSAYRRAGFRLERRTDSGDWPCLLLIKRPIYSWKRTVRANSSTSQPPGDYGTW